MDAAWELGITHFDTADAYGGGRSERGDRPLDQDPRRAPDGSPPRPTTRWTPAPTTGSPPSGSTASSSRASSGSASTASSSISRTSSTPSVPLAGHDRRVRRRSAPAAEIGAYGVSNFDAAAARGRARSGRARRRSRTSTRCWSAATRPAVLPLCERAPRRLLGVQPAGGRVADRQVPPGRAVSRRLADDPAPRALRAAGHRPHVRRARPARRRSARERGMSMAGVALAWLLADERIDPDRHRAGASRAPRAGRARRSRSR